jgi:homoserine O-acetyltransferase
MDKDPTCEDTKERVGRVTTHTVQLDLPPEGLELANGETLPQITVAYETYGTLAPAKDNVIFICHALSGDAHVAGYHTDPKKDAGWWDEMVGPGKGIDTLHYFVVCANILGGCKGTTGPSSINPGTGHPYGSDFPSITVEDIVDVHHLLLRHLGITRLAAVVGGSFGGMQVLAWAIRYPDMVERGICIASATSLSAQALAFDIVGRTAITTDPDWQGGDFYGAATVPGRGLSLARKIGHITYLSQEMMARKFGRERHERPPEAGDAPADPAAVFRSTFQVESYLEHQGAKFVSRFDANSYLHITRAMDQFDLEEQFGSLESAFQPIAAKILVVALNSDWLFPPEQSIEIAHALLRDGKRVSYCLLRAPHGHDAFLVDIEHLAEVLRAFLPWVRDASTPSPRSPQPAIESRQDEYAVITDMIRPNSRILDLGCGEGQLLSRLAERRCATGIGVDIDLANVIGVIDRGHDIFQTDIDSGLAMIPDGAYDYAVLSETLQVVRKPRLVLAEMLRVAREGIVTFPNFGRLTHGLQLLSRGRMPRSGALPYAWYDTPNIHLFTLKDFVELCRMDHIRIAEIVSLTDDRIGRWLCRMGFCNAGADRVLVRISRQSSGSCEPPRCRIHQEGHA